MKTFYYSLVVDQDQDMVKVTLDDHCGKMAQDFNSKRDFLNHVKNTLRIFLCVRNAHPVVENIEAIKDMVPLHK